MRDERFVISHDWSLPDVNGTELDGNVMVYRFSLPKVIEMLRIKAARLATPEMVTRIRPMTRSLALDGLGPTEDIEETLREGSFAVSKSTL